MPMFTAVGFKERQAMLNRLYESALSRSNFGQKEMPAVKVALQIADIGRRCSRRGPDSRFNGQRAGMAVAVSWFLDDHFGASCTWNSLPLVVDTVVTMDVLQRSVPRKF